MRWVIWSLLIVCRAARLTWHMGVPWMCLVARQSSLPTAWRGTRLTLTLKRNKLFWGFGPFLVRSLALALLTLSLPCPCCCLFLPLKQCQPTTIAQTHSTPTTCLAQQHSPVSSSSQTSSTSSLPMLSPPKRFFNSFSDERTKNTLLASSRQAVRTGR